MLQAIQTAEFPKLRAMAEITFRTTYQLILPEGQIDYMLDWMYSLARLEEQQQTGHLFYWIEQSNHPIGYVHIDPTDPQEIILEKIYLLPEYAGKGLGAKALIGAIGVCKHISPQGSLLLHVNRNNKKAIRFYTNHLFSIAKQGDFSIGKGYLMCDFVMKRPLSD